MRYIEQYTMEDIMDIKSVVDSVASKASEIAKTAAKKTGEVAESAKLTIALNSEKRKLDELFKELGRLFYEQAKGSDVRIQIAAQVMQIDEQKEVIEDLRDAISAAKGKIACDFCGKEFSVDAAHCPACGKKVEPKFICRGEKESDSHGEDTPV